MPVTAAAPCRQSLSF